MRNSIEDKTDAKGREFQTLLHNAPFMEKKNQNSWELRQEEHTCSLIGSKRTMHYFINRLNMFHNVNSWKMHVYSFRLRDVMEDGRESKMPVKCSKKDEVTFLNKQTCMLYEHTCRELI